MGKKASCGFSLIELLVVIVVIGILALIAYPAYTSVQERAKVIKDMNNLRQIGIATQMYMNDNDGTLFSPGPPTASWMSQLYPKYLSAWNTFISPFDSPVNNPAVPLRSASDNNANSAVSYGINGISPSIIGMSATKITKPTVFILFAPAQDNSPGTTVEFQGIANTTSSASLASSSNVTVLGVGSGKATSTPPGGTNSGTVPHGTHSSRTKINALFADLHCENMPWTTFANNTASTADPDAGLRWTPYTPYP